jgi:hypothetical protein
MESLFLEMFEMTQLHNSSLQTTWAVTPATENISVVQPEMLNDLFH